MLFKSDSEKIIILGLNEISLFLAKKLSQNKDVIIMYKKNNLKNYNIEETDIITQKIESNIYSELNKLNNTDRLIFLAITYSEIYNIFASRIASELHFKIVITLAYTQDYYQENLKTDLIVNPHQLIINNILTNIKQTRLLNIKRLIPGKINISKIKVKKEDSFAGIKIRNFKLDNSLILAIVRENKIYIANAEMDILPGDYIYWLYKKGFSDWFKAFKTGFFKKNKIFIFGGKKLCLKLIYEIKNIFETIVIIEPEIETCNFLASKLEKPLILNGEGTEYNLFKEEGMNQKSSLIALSSNDSQNILSSFCADNLSCQDVLTLINKSHHQKLADLLKLHKTLFPPEIIYKYIQKYFKDNLNLNKLEKDIYITKITLKRNSYVINKKIKNLNLGNDIIIGVIIRKKKIIIPDGNNSLKKDDTIILIFKKEKESKIINKFGSKRI